MAQMSVKELFDSLYGGGSGTGFVNREDYSTPNEVPAWSSLTPEQQREFIYTGKVASIPSLSAINPERFTSVTGNDPASVLSTGSFNYTPSSDSGWGLFDQVKDLGRVVGPFVAAAGVGGWMGGGFDPSALSSSWTGAPEFGGTGNTLSSALGTSGGSMDWTSSFGNETFDPSTLTSGSTMMPAAVPETAQQLTDMGLTQTSPGNWSLPPAGSSSASFVDNIKSALQAGNSAKQIAQMLGISEGAVSTIGKLLATGLGVAGANQQTSAYQKLAEQFAGYGAPYRARLAETYANPEGYLQSPDVRASVLQGTNALARSLSTQGNPAQSGHALQELQDYSANQLFGKLGQERDRLAGFGGLTAYNSAAPSAMTSATQSQGNALNAIGAGINQITNPQRTLAQELQDWKSLA